MRPGQRVFSPFWRSARCGSALLDAGMKALETTGPNELSLRQLAREVGVSPTAVYRHFPDKRALLGALAEAGVAMLFEEQSLAAAAAGGGSKGFAATGRAYVRFAIAHPGLFRLIFTHAELAGGPELSDNPAGRPAIKSDDRLKLVNDPGG